MRLSPRTVFLLCTLLLGMQLGALSHASEHLQDIDHNVCQLCSFNDRSQEQISAHVDLPSPAKAPFLPSVITATGIQSLSIAGYQSRAPPHSQMY